MLDIYYKSTKTNKLQPASRIRKGAWINLADADQTKIEEICKIIGLETADLMDALDNSEVPRIERQDDAVLIFLRTARELEAEEELHTDTLTVVITDEYFITISTEENPIIKYLVETQSTQLNTTQRVRMLGRLLVRVASDYTRRIKLLRKRVTEIQQQAENVSTEEITALTNYENVLNQYLSSLIPMRNVFSAIINGKYLVLYEEDEDLFEDMLINIQQSVDVCQVNIKSIQSLRESFQVIFNNRLNQVIKFLTSFTIIMTIPTIVASLFGMNVAIPFADNPAAFVIVLLISVAISGIFLAIFLYKKWI